MKAIETGQGEVKELFQQLYAEYYASLVHFAEGYVGRREVAEDLVQELFAGLWEKELRFLSKAALNTYLYTSVKNLSLDWLKHQEVEHRYAERFLSDSMEKRREELLDEEVMRLLFQAIDRLPERCREIFLLHLDGLSNEEIARQLSLSILTVKTQKKKAMRLLRQHFNESEGGAILPCSVGWLCLLLLMR